jgi:hypothetical protein
MSIAIRACERGQHARAASRTLDTTGTPPPSMLLQFIPPSLDLAALPAASALPTDLGEGWSGYADGVVYNPQAAWSLGGQRAAEPRPHRWSVACARRLEGDGG